MEGDKLVAVATLLLVAATIALVVTTWQLVATTRRVARSQEDLQRHLANEASERQRQDQAIQQKMTEQQRAFAQRSHLIPLWQYISGLSDINPSHPITPHIIDAANTLEFIAIACEADVVDRSVIMRAFREKYMEFYENIEKCGRVEGFNPPKSGKDILRENRATQRLYDQLVHERLNTDLVRPIV